MDSFRASEQVSPERKRDKAREMGTRFKTFPRGGSRPKGGESEGGGGGRKGAWAGNVDRFASQIVTLGGAPSTTRGSLPHLFFVLNWRRGESTCVRSGAKRESRRASLLKPVALFPKFYLTE